MSLPLFAGIGFALGALALHQFAALPSPAQLAPLTALLLLSLLPRMRLLLWPVAGFLWAWWVAHGALAQMISPELEGRDLLVVGVVEELPQQLEYAQRFVFRILESEPLSSKPEATGPSGVPKRVRLSWYRSEQQPRVGERWRLVLRLKRPAGFRNPGGFDYEGWMFRERLGASGYVRKDRRNERLAAAPLGVNPAREGIAEAIARALGENAGIVTALAVGDRSGIDPAQWEQLITTGTNHLIAISGLHIGLVAGAAFFIVAGLWRVAALGAWRPAREVGALAAIWAAAGYALLAGLSIPTQRALVMVIVVALALLLRRPLRPGAALNLALITVLLVDPLAVMTPSLWLSFSAVAAILYAMSARARGAPPSRLRRVFRGWGRIQLLLGVALLPLTLLLFQQASIIAPLANLIAVPWVSLVVVPSTLLGVIALPLSESVAVWCWGFAQFNVEQLLQLLELMSAQPLARWQQQGPPLWSWPIALLGILLLLAPRALPGRWLGLPLLAPLFLLLPERPPHGAFEYTQLDVGQGVAAVVQTARHTLVYDTGPRFSPRFDTGEAVVLPYLRERGIRRVDLVVISHGDNDHIGGAESLLKNIVVDAVASSVPDEIEHTARRFCTAGEQWRWDGVEFRFLHPPPRWPGSKNDRSCVLRVSAPGGSLLLTADIESWAESRLLREARDHLDVDIVLIPHHGSRSSSTAEWVAAVAPRHAVVTAGYRNRWGFPKEEVMERYRERGASIWSGIDSGAIRFRVLPEQGILPPERYRPMRRRFWHR